MNRPSLLLALCLLNGCVPAKIQAIIDQYDTFGSTFGSTDASGSSTTEADTSSSTTGTESTESDTTSTGNAGSDTSTSSTTTVLDTSSNTTAPIPVCGDGNLDEDEECDDMNDNPDDGCKLCTHDRLVFASSTEWQGGALQGLFGADQRCRMLAGLALLPNAFSYRAWLSDSRTAAADRILHSKGRYTLVNGLVVAADWDALISGTLENPVNVTEKSEISNGSRVWTGTLPNGQQAFGAEFCDDWTDNSMGQFAGTGLRNYIDQWWSFFEQDDCASEAVLYCIEN